MAGKGPPPKDPTTLRRRNKRPEVRTVEADGRMFGTPLPPGLEWHPQTRIWWDNWRAAAQAQLFQPSEWDFLLDTAILHTLYWNGDQSVAAELRLRVSKFGATPEDRMRLRIEVGDPNQSTSPTVADPAKEGRYSHLRAVR